MMVVGLADVEDVLAGKFEALELVKGTYMCPQSMEFSVFWLLRRQN